MNAAIDHRSSAKALLTQMLKAASSASIFKGFLATHMAAEVEGTVVPRYRLSKPETIKRFAEAFGFASGGTVSLLTAVEDGRTACGRVLLTQRKHDLKSMPHLDPRAELVVEATIWLELDERGLITHLHFVADMLTPGMALGRQMVKAPKPTAEATAT